MHCVSEGGGGFYMMCAGSSESSLVANSIRTQISGCLQEAKWTIVLWETEKTFFFILFYFYLTRHCLFTCRCFVIVCEQALQIM